MNNTNAFRNNAQRAAACRRVLQIADVDPQSTVWTMEGPTALATTIRDALPETVKAMCALTDAQLLMVRVAWDVWDGSGRARLGDLIEALDSACLRTVATLMKAIAQGNPLAIDSWLVVYDPRFLTGDEIPAYRGPSS